MSTPQHRSHLVVILGGIIVAAGAVLAFFYLRGKKLPAQNNLDALQSSPSAAPKQAAAASVFPIGNGSSGDLVKQLQAALGVSADGKFGPKTLAALTGQTGLIQITSQGQFNQIITTLQNKPVITAAITRSAMLITQFNASPTSRMMAIEKVTATKVIQDASGALQPAGTSLVMQPDIPRDHDQYQPVDSTVAGYLLFKINGADNPGLYKVDPNKITIV